MYKKLAPWIGLSLLTYAGLSQANVLQYFGFQSDNPASLQFIQGNELIVGGSAVFPHVERDGTFFGQTGSADMDNDTQFAFPEFRYAHRFSPKLVLGLDVSEPILGMYPWKADDFAAAGGYGVNVDSLSFVPKISYAITDSFTLGAGFAATHISFDNAFAPAGPSPYYLQNTMDGWGYSFQAGAMYKINPQTFIDFTYLSPIKADVGGDSTFGPKHSHNLETNNWLWLPNTYELRLTRFMTQKWLAVAEVDYSTWSDEDDLILKNTAAGPAPFVTPIDGFWDNTWRFALFNRYQLTEKFAPFLSVSYETTPQSDSDKLYTIYPTGDLILAALGGDYQVTKELKVTGFAGSSFWPKDRIAGIPNGTSFNPAATTSVDNTGNYFFVGGNLTYDWA